MPDSPDLLDELWAEAGRHNHARPPESTQRLRRASRQRAESTHAHLVTIGVLSLTLLGVVLFFAHVVRAHNALSLAAVSLMIASLGFRIGVEAVSYARATRVDILADARRFTAQVTRLVRFRKTAHGWVTGVCLAGYTLGFALFAPLFWVSLGRWATIGIYGSYVVMAIVLIYVIRQGVRREQRALAELERFAAELNRLDNESKPH